jgi:hypothetical protein
VTRGGREADAEALRRAEAAGWTAVRAAGLDETADGAAWQAVFFAAQRAALERELPRPPVHRV